MIKTSKDQILRRIRLENPWWESSKIDSDLDLMGRRAYFELLFPLILEKKVNRAVIVMGPRRVGKTVILYHTVSELLKNNEPPNNIIFLGIDNPVYAHMPLHDLVDLAIEAGGSDKSKRIYIYFDEIQYLKDWHVHLKVLVDKYRTFRFVASGSAAAALARTSKESGAGRFTEFFLPPVLFCEFLRFTDQESIADLSTLRSNPDQINTLNEAFIDYMNFGGFPEAIFSPAVQKSPERFIRSDILDKILLRDLPSLYGIQDVQELNSIFTMLAYNTAQELSLEELSKNSGVPKGTISRYLEYLEAAFLIQRSHKLGEDGKNFQRKRHFKIFLTNPGIRSALFTPIAADDEHIGAMVETAIVSQLFHDGSRLNYARWKQGEIDVVVVDKSEKVRGVLEVKWSNRFADGKEYPKELVHFCKRNSLSRAFMTTRTQFKSINTQDVHINFVPSAYVCYSIGMSVLKGKGIDFDSLQAEF